MARRIPPLALVALLALLMWLAARGLPQFGLDWAGRLVVAAVVGATGIAICGAGLQPFLRAGTTVDPRHPERVSRLVTTGIYSVTRNPMYLGMLFVLAAWAVFLSNAAALLIGPPAFAWYLNRHQIVAEEQALAAAFGREYTDYVTRVRRWI